MGWAGGSHLMQEIIDVLNEVGVEDSQKKTIYSKLIEAFQNEDCDTLEECLGEDKVYDEALQAADPEGWSDYVQEDEDE